MKPKDIKVEPKTLGEHLKRRRTALGLTQAETGQRLGVTAWTVINWENGKTEPPAGSLPVIFCFLGYDPFPEPTSLAETLASTRRQLGWSKRRMAETLGVDEATWAGWEAGMRVPRGKHLALIERLLAARPEEIPSALVL